MFESAERGAVSSRDALKSLLSNGGLVATNGRHGPMPAWRHNQEARELPCVSDERADCPLRSFG